MQSLETDGAQAAKAFTVGNETFLFIANGGSVGRYETKSRLYKVLTDGTVSVVSLVFFVFCLISEMQFVAFTSNYYQSKFISLNDFQVYCSRYSGIINCYTLTSYLHIPRLMALLSC